MLSKFEQREAQLGPGEGVAAVALLLIGFVVGKIFTVPGVTIDKEVDPLAAIALLLTVLASFVLFRRFERVKYADQVKKDAVMDRLRSPLQQLQQLEDLCEQAEIPWVGATRLIKRCASDFEGYSRFTARLNGPVEDGDVPKYVGMCRELGKLLTDTPRRGEVDPDLRVVDGNILVSAGRRVQVERKIGEAKEFLYQVQTRVILDLR
ncbi:MAG TPA: hypothetical protein VGR37_20080 [Longimicrobiaceae bacterium]|nr:hypothetical protein [Longimicrobiaceae bacterium]